MQNSQEIQTQIKQVKRESEDITRSLDRLTDTQDLLDAHQELKNRSDVLVLLQRRLVTAQENEQQQRQVYEENEEAQAQAKAEYEEIGKRLQARRRELIRHVTAELDELDPLQRDLNVLENKYREAWLRNHPDSRHDPHGWPRLNVVPLDDLSGNERHADGVLHVLYASRLGLPGSLRDLQIAAQGQASAMWRSLPTPTQEPTVTIQQQAEQISAEMRERVMSGFRDNIG